MRIKPTLVERQSEGHLWWSQRKTAISAALCISARKDDWQERNRCAARMYQHKRTKTVCGRMIMIGMAFGAIPDFVPFLGKSLEILVEKMLSMINE